MHLQVGPTSSETHRETLPLLGACRALGRLRPTRTSGSRHLKPTLALTYTDVSAQPGQHLDDAFLGHHPPLVYYTHTRGTGVVASELSSFSCWREGKQEQVNGLKDSG